MTNDLEEILETVGKIVFDKVKHHGMNDRTYEKAISQELANREVIHEAHKKIYDERKGKYRFIDLYFPDHGKFVTLKARKYITRTELRELKEDEITTGLEGMIMNFYNGVNIRHGTSGRSRDGSNDQLQLAIQSPSHHLSKSRTTLPHLSGSTGMLNEISPPLFRPGKVTYNGYANRYPVSVVPLDADREMQIKTSKIFALSCAAFFLSDGNRKDFAKLFNELLESMRFHRILIPERFLRGPRMTTPDGELAEILRKSLNLRKRNKKKENNNNPGKSSKNNSPEEELYYIGFDNKEEG